MKEYSKPTIAEMGDANRLIQGSKLGEGDALNPLINAPQDECNED
ncbi:MAG: hypothetical protein ACRD2U_04875 [Terriglobales bacterium]